MPFIPHTDEEIKLMLQSIGVKAIDDLFDEIPNELFSYHNSRRNHHTISHIPDGLTEMMVANKMEKRAALDAYHLNFIGAGSYQHYIPALVWQIASRGEWMTGYTPYQAEASQGTLQLIYEYQTMMSQLMNLPISNASLYEGASALAEAILMAIRCSKNKETRILMPVTVHPFYRQVVKTIVSPQNIEIIELDYDRARGVISLDNLKIYEKEKFAAMVIPMPNFFGLLEEVDRLTEWVKKQGAMVIGLVNPIAMALLKPPGSWGELLETHADEGKLRLELGADIACGEGQPLGIPMSSGGPYFGFLCCKKEYIRQLPGRLVGRTTDNQDRIGYTLTLQAREQHIRRAKATSNICTNQGLLVTAATLYISLLGSRGLHAVALKCHQNTVMLAQKLSSIAGVELMFQGTHFFHEIVVKFQIDAENVLNELSKQDILGGFNLSPYYSELKNCLLISVTETKSEEDIDVLISAISTVLSRA